MTRDRVGLATTTFVAAGAAGILAGLPMIAVILGAVGFALLCVVFIRP